MRRSIFACLMVLFPTAAFAQAGDEAPAEAAEAAPAPAPGPATFKVSNGKTSLLVRTYKGGVMSAVAHDHAIASTQTSGTITWDAAAGACTMDITVDVPSLRVDAAQDRRKLGLDGDVGADDQAEIRKNMMAADQLNAAAHKTMTFKSTACSASKVTGSLTIRGKSKTVSFTPKLDTSAGFSLSGGFDMKHTDFGFDGYSAALGAIRNEDKLTMKFTVVGE